MQFCREGGVELKLRASRFVIPPAIDVVLTFCIDQARKYLEKLRGSGFLRICFSVLRCDVRFVGGGDGGGRSASGGTDGGIAGR